MSQKLVQRRDVLKGLLKRALKAAQELADDVTEREIKVKLESVEKNYALAIDTHMSVMELTGAEEVEFQEIAFEEIQTYYEHVKHQLLLRMDELNECNESVSDVRSTNAPAVPPRAEIKLPQLHITPFSGDYNCWNSFRDMFDGAIGKRRELSGAQKLQYLKSFLQGEAAQLVRGYMVTDGNYRVAWAALEARYDNKRLLVNAQFQRLFGQHSVQGESAAMLRQLVDTTIECVQALRAMELPTDEWSAVLVYIVTQRLDADTHKQWEISLTDNEFPSFEDLTKFIEKRCRSLEAIGSMGNAGAPNNKPVSSRRTAAPSTSFGRSSVHHAGVSAGPTVVCVVCNEMHAVHKCKRFRAMNVSVRRNIVQQRRLCFVCLRVGHLSSECNAPTCTTCSHKHHDLLHITPANSSASAASATSAPVAAAAVGAAAVGAAAVGTAAVGAAAGARSAAAVNAVQSNFGGETQTQVLLSTAWIRIDESTERIRALVDQGSHASMIRESCVQRLNLQRTRVSVPIRGIGGTAAGTATAMVQMKVKSCADDSLAFDVTALVMRKLTGVLPSRTVISSNRPNFVNLTLADPTYYEPGEIDVIIGADVYGLMLRDGLIVGSGEPGRETPTAQNTALGWILSGRISAISVPNASSPSCSQSMSAVISLHLDVERQLRRFWEIEEVDNAELLSDDEKRCEAHFVETHTRDETGRYVVRLPFSAAPELQLGNSRDSASRRLRQIERRLTGKPDLRAQYQAFMDEYLALGHMRLASGPPVSCSYYLPHHFVVKESSSTTRLRVVFDASSKTSSGCSLNDLQYIGPRLQHDLTAIVMRFRKHAIAITGDVAKMYRQVNVHEADWDYQRILWRNNPDENIADYQLTTVTYGMAASPFMAVRALQQLARDEEESHPSASRVVLSDFYVDDLITGCDNLDDAKKLQVELSSLMARGGFELRKWTSNNEELLQSIPPTLRESVKPLHLTEDTSVKTLGLQWFPAADYFGFKVTPPICGGVVTKRSILSVVARLFDPLGLLAPTIIVAKILIQQLWALGIAWDEQVPEQVRIHWAQYHSSLPALEQLRFPRWIGAHLGATIQLHGFADASEVAYGGVVYSRCSLPDGTVVVSLLTAKTRVAPLQQLTIPRLELCAAVLVAKLMRNVRQSYDVAINDVTLWSDSQVALCWIRKEPRRWKTFVANRVATIQSMAAPANWRYVPTTDNPADCLSRGVQPADLADHPLWLQGPGWLKGVESEWPTNKREAETRVDEREAANAVLTVHADDGDNWLQRYSSISTLTRITALLLRFARNCRGAVSERVHGFLTANELRGALLVCVRLVQSSEYADEIRCIRRGADLLRSSKLFCLSPFLDEQGVLRVRGRIRYAALPTDVAHPAIMPSAHHLTALIIADAHIRSLHGGAQMMMNLIRQQFWIIGGKDRVRKHVHGCLVCFRQRPRCGVQQMGDLPAERVTASRAFLRSGVDYAGPMAYKSRAGRGARIEKGYVALFVCLVTKAVHLEFVSDLSAVAFIAAFRRFVARRGKCAELLSDNATNFVGAKRMLGEIHRSHAQTEDIARVLAADGTNWRTIPPRSPHFGGLWEAGVKAVKHHLRRIVGQQLLTFEEYATTLAEIEAVLNSRPLSALSDDADDYTALTPGHFLVGGSPIVVPETNVEATPINRLARWQLQRYKWTRSTANIQIGQLVLLKDDLLPPAKWRLARVTGTRPGDDGRVRVVDLKYATGRTSRAITQICALPIDLESTTVSH